MSETEKLSKMRRQKNLFEIKEQGKNLGGGDTKFMSDKLCN